jgi:tetratricopeptide (TPR) repeat protein
MTASSPTGVQWRTRITAILLVAVALGALGYAQMRMDSIRSVNEGDEARYLPNEKLLSHFTLGLSSVIADALWLKSIQYVAKHYRSDQDYEWLKHIFSMIFRLDPYFEGAYRYAGIFLPALQGDYDSALGFLEQGMRNCPFSWRIPYETAMIWLVNLKNRPNSEEMAARYLALAVATGKAPEFVGEVAVSLQAKHDLEDIEQKMWEEAARDGDKFMKELAAQKLLLVDIRRACKRMDELVVRLSNQQGRAVADLAELVTAGLLPEIPTDPLGGRFLLSPGGKVLNTSLLDDDKNEWVQDLNGRIKRFKEEQGRLPVNLREIVEKGYCKPDLPPHPYPGGEWGYDPVAGKVL